MIKLELDGDLISYIDIERLQKNAEYEVAETIRNTITKMILFQK